MLTVTGKNKTFFFFKQNLLIKQMTAYSGNGNLNQEIITDTLECKFARDAVVL